MHPRPQLCTFICSPKTSQKARKESTAVVPDESAFCKLMPMRGTEMMVHSPEGTQQKALTTPQRVKL